MNKFFNSIAGFLKKCAASQLLADVALATLAGATVMSVPGIAQAAATATPVDLTTGAPLAGITTGLQTIWATYHAGLYVLAAIVVGSFGIMAYFKQDKGQFITAMVLVVGIAVAGSAPSIIATLGFV